MTHRQRLNKLGEEQNAAKQVAPPDDVVNARLIQLVLLQALFLHRLFVALLYISQQLQDAEQH